MRILTAIFGLVVVGSAAACGGQYASSDRTASEVQRGETNGRVFDFVSNLPDGEDWQVRVRDSSLWASYSEADDVEEFKPVNLDRKETRKLWDLIDTLDIGGRKKGKEDEDEGYVTLRLREPGGEEGHDMITVYVSRATEDEDVLAVGAYLQELILKYHKREADF